MKYNFVLLATALVLMLSACKKDKDDDSCIRTDFIGTYQGANTCDGESPEDVVFSIREEDGELFMVDDEQEEYPLKTDGCNISIPSIDLFLRR